MDEKCIEILKDAYSYFLETGKTEMACRLSALDANRMEIKDSIEYLDEIGIIDILPYRSIGSIPFELTDYGLDFCRNIFPDFTK